MPRVVEDLPDSAGFDDLALEHHRHAVGRLRNDAEVVRDEEERELKSHSKSRTPVAEIAKKMKRTERALRRKAGLLGSGLGHNR